MPLDPSISQGITPPPSPLDIAGKAATLQNHLNQSALFNLNTQSQLAVGQILQQSTAEDGTIDLAKARSLTRDSPLAAFGMQAVTKQTLENQLTQAQIAEKYLTISHAALDVQNGYIAALQGKKDGGTDAEVSNAFDTAWKSVQDNPAIPEQMKMSMRNTAILNRANLPPPGPGREEWVAEHARRAMDSKTKLDALTGHIGTIDNGNTQTLWQYSPQLGTTRIIGVQQKGATPETASALTPKGETGEMVPRADVAPLSVGGAFQGSTGFGSGGAVGGGAGPGTGQPQPQPGEPSQPGTPLGPQAGGATSPAGLTVGGSRPQSNLLTGPSPIMAGPKSTATSLSQSTNITNLGKSAADYVDGLNHRVNAGSYIMQRMKEVQGLLDGIETGGFQDVIWTKMADLARTAGASNSLVDALNRGDRSKTAEFEKLMVSNAMDQMTQAFGGSQGGSHPSDLRVTTFLQSNPNIRTDKDAIKKIMNFTSDVYARDFSEQTAFTKASHEPGFNIRDWPNQWQHMLAEKGIIDKPGTHVEVPPRQPPAAKSTGPRRSIDDILQGHGLK